MLCNRCGQSIPDESRFCLFCGKRLSGAKAVKVVRDRRKRGTGNIHEHKGRPNPFEARIKGKSIGYYPTRADAVNALDNFVAESKPVEYRTVTFAKLYELWKAEHDKIVSKSSSDIMHQAYKRAEVLHKRRFAELKAADYQSVINAVEENGASKSLVEKQKQLFTSMCTFAMKQDIIDKNYASYTTITAKEKNPEKHDRVFTAEEIAKFESYVGHAKYDRIARIVLTLIYSGMRITELLIMERANVHVDERYMVGGVKTEAGKNRIIPIHTKILPYIKAWMGTDTASPFLIPNAKSDRPLDAHNVRKYFNAFMVECGVTGATIHNTRHTCSTLLLSSGASPDAVKNILGHASITTTVDVYSHPDVSVLLSNIEKI